MSHQNWERCLNCLNPWRPVSLFRWRGNSFLYDCIPCISDWITFYDNSLCCSGLRQVSSCSLTRNRDVQLKTSWNWLHFHCLARSKPIRTNYDRMLSRLLPVSLQCHDRTTLITGRHVFPLSTKCHFMRWFPFAKRKSLNKISIHRYVKFAWLSILESRTVCLRITYLPTPPRMISRSRAWGQTRLSGLTVCVYPQLTFQVRNLGMHSGSIISGLFRV